MGVDALGVPEVPRSSLALLIKLELIPYADILELRRDLSVLDQLVEVNVYTSACTGLNTNTQNNVNVLPVSVGRL